MSKKKITKYGRCDERIKSGIQRIKMTFHISNILFIPQNLSTIKKNHYIKTFVWSIAVYGYESWTYLLQA